MKVSLYEDEWGLELATDRIESEHCISLNSYAEVVQVRDACNLWLKENNERTP